MISVKVQWYHRHLSCDHIYLKSNMLLKVCKRRSSFLYPWNFKYTDDSLGTILIILNNDKNRKFIEDNTTCVKIHMAYILIEIDRHNCAWRHFVFRKVYLWSYDITKIHFSIITYIYPSPQQTSMTMIQLLGEMFDLERKCWLVQATGVLLFCSLCMLIPTRWFSNQCQGRQ